MGDISVEPSMEDILSSIKRIIAEEGDAATGNARAARKPPRPITPRADPEPFGHDEILELSDPVGAADRYAPEDQPAAEIATPIEAAPQPAPQAAAPQAAAPQSAAPKAVAPDSILSPRTAEASRGALAALSRLVVKPEVPGADSLEGMVRDMIRPMLREWLDAKLPEIVEGMVAAEIARITGQPR